MKLQKEHYFGKNECVRIAFDEDRRSARDLMKKEPEVKSEKEMVLYCNNVRLTLDRLLKGIYELNKGLQIIRKDRLKGAGLDKYKRRTLLNAETEKEFGTELLNWKSDKTSRRMHSEF